MKKRPQQNAPTLSERLRRNGGPQRAPACSASARKAAESSGPPRARGFERCTQGPSPILQQQDSRTRLLAVRLRHGASP